MTFVPQSRILPRSLWRPALFFFAVAQVFLSFAPLLEWHNGETMRTHVEAAGTGLHHAHDESDCAACVARGILASANIERSPVPTYSRAQAQIVSIAGTSGESTWLIRTQSRAPPRIA